MSLHEITGQVMDWINAGAETVTGERGAITSPHEGWALLREECIETWEMMEALREHLFILDEYVRNDTPLPAHEAEIRAIHRVIGDAVAELIDAGVVAKRYEQAATLRRGAFARLPEETENVG